MKMTPVKKKISGKLKSDSQKPNPGKSPARVRRIVETWGKGESFGEVRLLPNYDISACSKPMLKPIPTCLELGISHLTKTRHVNPCRLRQDELEQDGC